MFFILEFDTEDPKLASMEPFAGDALEGVARILRQAAASVDAGITHGSIQAGGKVIGHFKLSLNQPKDSVYRHYLLKWCGEESGYSIQKGGVHIGWAKTLQDAKRGVDEVLGEDQK